MTPNEYLDEAKKTMGISSDYELAKRLEVNRGWITGMREGTRNIPLAITFKLAITLSLDPATVLADLESQREKNPKRAEFWKSFLSRAALVVLVACTLAWHSIGMPGPGPSLLGGALAVSAAFFLCYWVRIISDYDQSPLSHHDRRLQEFMENLSQNRFPPRSQRACTARA